MVKKLIPIVIVTVAWGKTWRGAQVQCCCDHEANVTGLAARLTREAHIMHLLRCLFFIDRYMHNSAAPYDDKLPMLAVDGST